MKDLSSLREHMIKHPVLGWGDSDGGAFAVYSKTDPSTLLRIIASNGGGWDHVSVSTDHRCPTWDEMSQVHRMFFLPTEVALQLHVPEDKHINLHNYTLHLWRNQRQAIELPPSAMV
jgi:hypothetical protein